MDGLLKQAREYSKRYAEVSEHTKEAEPVKQVTEVAGKLEKYAEKYEITQTTDAFEEPFAV